MKIKDYTYSNNTSNFIFHIFKDGLKVYTLYVRNPSTRSTLAGSCLHLKNKGIINRCFRVYSNLYINQAIYNSTLSYFLT